jgi:4-hydroxymandelate oxidase
MCAVEALIHCGLPQQDIESARPVSLPDLEALARAKLTGLPWEFLDGASADEITKRANHQAFDRLLIVPRVLRDVRKVDTRVTLFGRIYEFPILLAPVGYHALFHSEAEIAVVRGANACGATLVASAFATRTVEEMCAAAEQPMWFQLYVMPDRPFTLDLIHRAEAAGCEAICITVDFPVGSARDREQRAGFRLPAGCDRANLRALGAELASKPHRPRGREFGAVIRSADATWEDIERIKSSTRLPVLLKGILHPDDAAAAVAVGADGIIVSNHGGRALDTVPATIDVLPAVVNRVGGAIPVLVDGGIRRGTDVCKALALGAAAVLIGRPYIWGLAVDGAAGVAHCVDLLRTELEMALALLGRSSLRELDRSIFWQSPSGHTGTEPQP